MASDPAADQCHEMNSHGIELRLPAYSRFRKEPKLENTEASVAASRRDLVAIRHTLGRTYQLSADYVPAGGSQSPRSSNC